MYTEIKLSDLLAAYGTDTALTDDRGRQLSYCQLLEEAGRITDITGRRRLVFCLCENSMGSVLGYLAFLTGHIVPMMLSSRLDALLLRRLMDLYGPAYIWAPGACVQGDLSGMSCVYRAYDYCLLKTDRDMKHPLHGNLALLLSTSGSTGSPKFVRQTYENIWTNARSIVDYLKLDATERPVTTLPMNYTYGLSVINSHILVGARVLVTEKGIMQKEFWSFMKEQRATSLSGVPYTYEMLDKLRFFQMDLPSLRTMTQAGGKLALPLHEKFAAYAQRTGRKFVVMYGQCEATARMGYLPPEKAVDKKGSMGIAIPGGKFRLMDLDGREIRQPDTTGELVYEGRNVAYGYAQCGDDLQKGDEWGGVLATGDMARMDPDGYFYIVGRKKRFLKIYGNRVNLDELDRMIQVTYHTSAVCAGEDDHLYIFLTDGHKAAAVRNFVIQKTGLNPAAFQTVCLDEIPRTESGKVQYTELVKYWKKKSV